MAIEILKGFNRFRLNQGVALVPIRLFTLIIRVSIGKKICGGGFDFGDQKRSLVLDKLMEAAISAAVARLTTLVFPTPL